MTQKFLPFRQFPVFILLLAFPFLFENSEIFSPDLDICEIQGPGLASPHDGDLVETHGVVTFDRDSTGEKGFFIQDANCDGDPGTSDALFVYTGEQVDIVKVGDVVQLSGWVDEFGGMTEISAAPEYIEVVGTGSLPPPANFSPPLGDLASRNYFEDHEGMRIAMSDTVVVGPTNSLDQTFVVETSRGITRIFHGEPAGPIVRISNAGLYVITPEVGVGANVKGLIGILDVSNGDFHVRLTAAPGVLLGPVPPIDTDDWQPSDFTFATLNLHNLFDSLDDPGFQDPVLSPGAYQTKLEKLARTISDILEEPFFIAVQEAEKGAVLQSLANRPEITAQYGYVWVEGPDFRGIDVGLLYRLDRVNILSFEQRQGCTGLIDGLGPDGNLDVSNPINGLTCDYDGQPGLDGNRLFSRPPLVIHLEICAADCSLPGDRTPLWVIAVHLKSKSQDTSVQYTLPRRLEQANFLTERVAEIQAFDPDAGIVVLGDFNDYLDSETIKTLTDSGLIDLVQGVPFESRYSYIYDGVSQVLDHVFINQSLAADPLALLFARPQHISADYPSKLDTDPVTFLRSSDHDPVLVRLLEFTTRIFIPILENGE